MPATQHELTVAAISSLPRDKLMQELLHFEGAVRLDFTEEFLAQLSDERLRHILLAACIHGHPNRFPNAGSLHPPTSSPSS